MIQVFCDKRGTGKTKALINMANEAVYQCKGDIVYIDYNKGPILQLDRKIRFVDTSDFNIEDSDSFYGLLCGMLSEDYDIETIFIDGLFNIVSDNVTDAARLFLKIERLSVKFNLNFFININHENTELPEYIRKYVA